MATPKGQGRDFPLSPTPQPTPQATTDSSFRQKLRAAKQAHKLEAARNGTLNDENVKKWKNVVGVVKDVVETVGTGVGAATGIKSMSGGRDNNSQYRK